MPSINILTRRINNLMATLNPPPVVIDCTGARDDLLMMLNASMSDDERDVVCVMTSEMQAESDELSEMLGLSIARIQCEGNIRFISYDQ